MVDQQYAGLKTLQHGLDCQELVYYILHETEGVGNYLPTHAADHCDITFSVTCQNFMVLT